ncbi:DUF262 domain-containing protein [Vibrio parahaemolyticus]|uniref:DUF262 domain-containing protein n=1 Tax=Vibrio parahaemolyticus TaxID=670 RepID=UPI0003A99241|nr:DUF262 domain-containing protein [Vibrio parahaemolyticus]AYO04905.1 DUF262 domain-containing protein [Vibrio parahaemolyticus]EGQ9442378.1 DUF262 domain-containing protein [Vibrio parahaemolyticus]EGQ9693554.1 DUF262 domain-containing protein [Vibrio parahaemolyticus]EGR1958856.1 DUF262 domain-containing protein [Vibrio parahaemolyticus]EGR1968037.1 DUF262 domain-containing protein [Vibrio parahaemolyticus]
MAYSSLSIKQLITDISDSKYYLPAIQRKFVWGEEKICNLFDSIMRDYPIGTFLFWDLPAEKADQYTFYEFLKNYHQRDSKNELVRKDFTQEVRGVLDGQQRISSLYIALQGVYCSKRKYAKKTTDNAYPKRQLYLNLFGDERDYEFKFLEQKDALEKDDSKYFYLVRDILKHGRDVDPQDIIEELEDRTPSDVDMLRRNGRVARKKLFLLAKKLNQDELINYFKIVDKDLDDILDIFVRVNSGGTILSKSDLLFSTLVAHWEDGREHIEQLIETINGEDSLFNFNTDFLMRTCLFLIDAPMSFKVQTFDRSNIAKIRDNWEAIFTALTKTSSILREFGFNKTRLSSNYAATPIAYYVYKGGRVDKESKAELRKLVIHSLLKQIYSGQADSALSGLRDGLRDKREGSFPLKQTSFSFSSFQHTKLAGGKRLTIDGDDIEDFLEYKKGSFCFLLLSVLYPDLQIDQISFHQDHMHPHSGFKTSALVDMGLQQEDITHWQNLRDQLPNLQLLEGQENAEKQATPLDIWVSKSGIDEQYYRQRNYVPATQSLKLVDFALFFEARKRLMRKQLHLMFDVDTEEKVVELTE